MSQNLVNRVLTDEQITAASAALDQLETALGGLASLKPEERRSLTRMGPKSEAFVRQTLSVLQQNPKSYRRRSVWAAPRSTWPRWSDCAPCSTAWNAWPSVTRTQKLRSEAT